MTKFFEGLKIMLGNANTFMTQLFHTSLMVVGVLMMIDVVFPMLKMGLVQRIVWYVTQIIKLSFTIFTR